MNISSSHRIVRIQGKDSLEFLQGQLSNDLKSSKKEYLQKNAICNIKGRIIALLWVNKINDESFDLIVDSSIVEKTFETLKKYKVFYKSDMVLLKDEPKNYNILKTEDWKINCIKDGICEINSSTTEIFTPHDLGYQNLEIINFLIREGVSIEQQHLDKANNPFVKSFLEETLFLKAIDTDNINYINSILSQNENFEINKLLANGMTYLFYACSRGKLEIIDLLINYHADPYIPNDDGQYPMKAIEARKSSRAKKRAKITDFKPEVINILQMCLKSKDDNK